MTKFTNFNKHNISEIRDLLKSCFKALEEHNLLVEFGIINYASDILTTKITIKTKESDPDYVREFKRQFTFHNFELNMLNQSFEVTKGVTYKFLGFIPRKRTKIALCECNGKRYACDSKYVLRMLKGV